MEEAAKVKDDLFQVSEATRNPLEIDGLQKQAQIEKFQRIFENMTTKVIFIIVMCCSLGCGKKSWINVQCWQPQP